LAIKKTDFNEQRKTEWIKTESLENFLNPNNPNETVEGYPAPIRVYIKAKKA
jgi:tRNA (mo5U34)-methyltransferase